jgi:hypothetical protein
MLQGNLVRRGLAVIVGAVLPLGATAAVAEATFPGENGIIAFQTEGEIWTIDPVSGTQSRLVADAGDPAWSADGQRLAFTRTGGVWVSHADGSSQVQLSSTAGDRAPAWSPDGQRIAFERAGSVWVMRSEGTAKAQLASDARDPAWSPDGRRIAYWNSAGVWTMASSGADKRRVAAQIGPPSEDLGPDPWAPARPDWSPDGRQLVVEYVYTGPADSFLLYRLPATGGTLTRLGPAPLGGVPSWSPDGSQIVSGDAEGLKLVDAGGGWRYLREGDFFTFTDPAWQPLPPPDAGDTTPPFVAWRKPVSGQVISGVLSEGAGTCLVDAHDISGIARTENFIDGVLHDTQVSAPWSCEIDTRTLADGPHTLKVRAYDRAGNFAEASAHVIVGNRGAAAQPGSRSTTPSGQPGSGPGAPSAAARRVTGRQARRRLERVLAIRYRSFAAARRHRIRCRASRGRTVQTCVVKWSARGRRYTARVRVRRSDARLAVKVLSLRVGPKRS